MFTEHNYKYLILSNILPFLNIWLTNLLELLSSLDELPSLKGFSFFSSIYSYTS